MGQRGMVGREGGWGRERDGGERGRVGRDGGEGEGRGRGGMTVIHNIVIGMFNSNPMIPHCLNNNLT